MCVCVCGCGVGCVHTHMCMHACVSVCAHVYECMCTCHWRVEVKGQLAGVVPSVYHWVPGIKLRSSGLVASTITLYAISLAQFHFA